MMNRFLLRLKRIRYSRGFGVQSPFAFSLINNVINQKDRYYAYSEIEAYTKDMDNVTIRLYQLYFRLANFCCPEFIADYSILSKIDKNVFLLACPEAKVFSLDKVSDKCDECERIDLLRMTVAANYQSIYKSCLKMVDDNTMFIIEGISDSNESKSFWKDVVDDPHTVLTFDLYDVGLVFFNKKYYKQNYIVNF